jgi:hypothetical protein
VPKINIEKLMIHRFSDPRRISSWLRDPVDICLLDAINAAALHAGTLNEPVSFQVREECWKRARLNKVRSLVLEGWQQCSHRDLLPQTWSAEVKVIHQAMDYRMERLAELVEIFYQRSIPAILLENAAIMAFVHPIPHHYEFSDFDFLLLGDLPSVVPEMESIGYKYSSGTSHLTAGRIEFTHSGSEAVRLGVNFQNSLVARKWVRNAHLEPSLKELSGSIIRLGDNRGYTLIPEYFLFQLCTHNAAHGFIRSPGVRLHVDVDWYIRGSKIDWKAFLTLVHRYRISSAAYLALILPVVLFGTPVPSWVIDQLLPNKAKESLLHSWIAHAGLFVTDHQHFKRWTYPLFALALYDNVRDLLQAAPLPSLQ